jgi:hypothetical protein
MRQQRLGVRGGVLIMAVASGLIIASAGLQPALDAQASGGKTVTDVRKTCQITVPSDWTADLSTAYSPDKKISATVHGMRAQAFDAAKTTFTSANKPLKTLKDDGKILLYTMDAQPPEPGKSGWAAVKNTTPVCTVALLFPAGTKEATLQAIVDSLAAAAK